jgi:rsbT co-antagonist protein RsbR
MKTFQTASIDVAVTTSSRELLTLYQMFQQDVKNVIAFGARVKDRIPDVVDEFYVWMRRQPFFGEFFADEATVTRLKGLQGEYWQEFFRCEINEEYVTKRRLVGETHARIGLPLQAYLAAMNVSFSLFSDAGRGDGAIPENYGDEIRSMTKLMHLDTAIVVEEFTKVTNQIIAQQGQALIEMSTPVTAIWQDILMLPIVGIIDSKRAMDIMNAMLAKIADARAKVIILDISGVGVVDTAVANHLIKITKATKLMGCECVISGVSPAIAQTIVELGIEVGDIHTTATLRDALEAAFQRTGVALKDSGRA